jgi:uncharacterized protein YggE
MGTTVTTAGLGSSSAAPDAMRLHLSVRHDAFTVGQALEGCAAALERLGAAARRFTDDQSISSRGLNVWPRHGHPDGDGFQATHQVLVVCRGLDQAGALVTTLAEEVADNLQVDSVEPFVLDTEPLMREARERAFADSRAKAEELAALAGQQVLGAVTIVEGVPSAGPFDARAMKAEVATSFEPGTSAVTANVTVTWATAPA